MQVKQRFFRLGRIERRQHIVPLEDLHFAAVRAWNVGILLGAGFEIAADPTAGNDQRRRHLEDLRELDRAGSVVGLRFRIAGGIHLPFRQVILDLEMDCHLRQGGRRIGTGDQERCQAVLAFLVGDAVGTIAGPLRKHLANRGRRPHERRQLHLRPAPRVIVGRMGVEEIAFPHHQRAAGEDVGDRRLADLRRSFHRDEAAWIIGRQRPQDLVEIRKQLAVIAARETIPRR